MMRHHQTKFHNPYRSSLKAVKETPDILQLKAENTFLPFSGCYQSAKLDQKINRDNSEVNGTKKE